jgi:Rrf2 family iron-sulfur cluster assembly transcriptional regulator
LEQLFGKLRKGSQVKSVRGPGGGYILARDADKIRISDIIVAVDESIQTTRCTTGSSAGCLADNARCLTHDLWSELGNQIFLFLSSISLADVVENRVLGMSGRNFFPSSLFADPDIHLTAKRELSATD